MSVCATFYRNITVTKKYTAKNTKLREWNELSREQELRDGINTRTVAIAEGVNAEIKDRMEQEIKDYEEQLRNLGTEEVAELPEEVAVSESIMSIINGVPLGVYARNEDAAVIIQCEAESIVEKINKVHNTTVARLMERLELSVQTTETVTKQRDDLDTEVNRIIEVLNESTVNYNDLHVRYEEMESTVNRITLERDQALLYRDNAVNQLEEMKFELEQNRIELNRNREARALTEAERTAEQEEARQKFLNSRIEVYNIRYEDEYEIDTKWKLANIAETGKEVRYRADYEKGLYVEVTEERALEIQMMNKPVEQPPLVNEAEIFPTDANAEESLSELQPTTDGSHNEDNESSVGPDATEAVAETWEQAVDRRLNAIERRLNKDEPEYFHEVA